MDAQNSVLKSVLLATKHQINVFNVIYRDKMYHHLVMIVMMDYTIILTFVRIVINNVKLASIIQVIV